jgi:hypothetical protein
MSTVLYPAQASRGWQQEREGQLNARIQKNKTLVRKLKWLKTGVVQTTYKLFVGTEKEVVKS